jgi:hypothetical protein
MNVRTAAMSSVNVPPPASHRPNLMRRLVLLMLLVSAAALGVSILIRELPYFTVPIWREAFGAVALGLVAGLGARMTLRRRHGFVQLIAAVAALILGLSLLGYFTGWRSGLGPLHFGRSEVDWYDLARLVLGSLAAGLALAVGRRRVPRIVHPPAVTPPRQAVRSGLRWRPAGRALKGLLSRWTGAHPRPLRVNGRSGRTAGSSGAPRSGVALRPGATPKAPVKPKRRGLIRRRPRVRLALVEEHRCPYCLDLVRRSDPRGVRECEVCHTMHHADCWAITGTCQVPH